MYTNIKLFFSFYIYRKMKKGGSLISISFMLFDSVLYSLLEFVFDFLYLDFDFNFELKFGALCTYVLHRERELDFTAPMVATIVTKK